jgi:hypothetical protein
VAAVRGAAEFQSVDLQRTGQPNNSTIRSLVEDFFMDLFGPFSVSDPFSFSIDAFMKGHHE